MAKPLSRRKLLGTAIGVSAVGGSAYLAQKHGLIPPDHGGIYGIGETLTYASQRLLMSGHSRAREFNRSQISKVFPVNGDPPRDASYRGLAARAFLDWRLIIDGLVDHPSQFSLTDLRSYPSSSHITEQACEEGWSSIAEWTGVQLSHVLNLVGVKRQAKYVVYFSFQDDWWDSIDMPEALHPQTLLAYSMNGEPLSTGHRRAGSHARSAPAWLQEHQISDPHHRNRRHQKYRERPRFILSRYRLFVVRGDLS